MAYIGRNLEQFSNVEKLDNITFTNSVGPYNLLKGAVAFVPVNAQSLLIEVDGIIQASDSYTVSGSTITFGVSMASTSTMNSIVQLGVGLISTPADGTVSTAKLEDGAVTNAKLAGSIENAKLSNSSITINSSPVSLGGSVTVGETKPTFTSVTPDIATNNLTSLVIAGTNFGGSGIPTVDFQSTTGMITAASSVVRDSSTQLTVGCTLPTDGTYFIRIELNDGNAVRSATAVLNISDEPSWTTASGSLGTILGNFSGTVATVAATGDTVTYSETTSVLTNASQANCSLNSSTGVITTTDFGGSSTSETTYTFTIRATDAQGQTSDREFILASQFTTGGTITYHGGKTYHTFLADGTFVNGNSRTVDYLMVAGGGSGGSYGGGGGAGGLLNGSTSLAAASFSIVIGDGGVNPSGVSTSQSTGDDGDDTTFNSLTAIGGGGGADGSNAGRTGGSGSGGGYVGGTGGAGTAGQGNAGGGSSYGNPFPSGGGGGSGGTGGSATSNLQAGDGGPGTEFSTYATATSTGDSGYYAGGGAGGVAGCGGGYDAGGSGGSGGSGGGGDGGVGGSGQSAGQANTGGGGGSGAYCSGSNYFPQSGGSGIVIIRYTT